MISEITIFDIDFYVSSINVVIIIMISLTTLNFHDFTFLIIKSALIKVIKKTSFYLYSNNASNFILRDK